MSEALGDSSLSIFSASLIDVPLFTPTSAWADVNVFGIRNRVGTKDFNTLSEGGSSSPGGIWSDGTTMWIIDKTYDKIYAYNLLTKARDDSKDFNTLSAAGNNDPTCIWSDGTTMWVADNVDDKIYAYNLSTKARDASKDFDTLIAAGNTSPIWYLVRWNYYVGDKCS